MKEQDTLPARATGVVIEIGTELGMPEKPVVWLPSNTAEANSLHMGVVGDTGSGKTQFLKSFLYQASMQSKNNRGQKIKMLIMDYKNDYTGNKKGDTFLQEIGGKLVVPENIPLNLFSTNALTQNESIERFRYKKASSLSTFLSQIYSGVGYVQQSNLLDAVENAYKQSTRDPTMDDVYYAYRDIVPKADSVSGILRKVVELNIFSNHHDELLTFKEFFDSTLVIDLASFGAELDLKELIVAFFLQLYYEYMLGIEKADYIDGLRLIDSFVLVDEANELMKHEFNFLYQILTQGREYGIGAILASQYLSHFRTKKTNYIENLQTWNLMLEKSMSAKDLDAIGIKENKENVSRKIQALNIHQLLHKTHKKRVFLENKPFYKMINQEEND